LASRVIEAGGEVQYAVAYQRQLPDWTTERGELAAQAASDGSIWLFSSSQAIRNLATLCPDQTWNHARAVVTHARIAQTALALGFGDVLESRPSIPALVASIESRQ
jgi:uroporphyrinogen-III synthase